MRRTQPIEGRSLTTIRIGGPLRQLIESDQPAEFTALLQAFHRSKRPFVVIGKGSNIVFPPKAPQLTVLRYLGNTITPGHDNQVEVESGCTLSRLMGWGVVSGRSGLEFMIGIPGCLGGALAVNAGAFGHSISEALVSAEVMDGSGEIRTWGADDFDFSYRQSRLKHGQEIILRARFRLPLAPRAEIAARMLGHIQYRLNNHPVKAPSAGCFFKNPKPGRDGISAGKLIDQCGLKGLRQGDLGVSTDHANFIVNLGSADLTQLDTLCQTIQNTIRAQTGIALEREVIWITPDGLKI